MDVSEWGEVSDEGVWIRVSLFKGVPGTGRLNCKGCLEQNEFPFKGVWGRVSSKIVWNRASFLLALSVTGYISCLGVS